MVEQWWQRTLGRLPAPVRVPLELATATAVDSARDRVPGLAAEIAFWTVLSLPTLLLTFLGATAVVASSVGVEVQRDLLDTVASVTGQVFQQRTVDETILPLIRRLLIEGRGGVLSFGFLITIWSASRAVRVVLTALTIAYDIEDPRPGWKQRAYSVLLTIAGILVGLIIIPFLLAGPEFGRRLSAWAPIDPALETVWRIFYWPLAMFLATAVVASLYHFLAPWRTPWRRELPGALLAMLLWLAGSAALRVYVGQSFTLQASAFQPFATPIAVLLWVYVSGFAVLLGAELNSELEKRWPAAQVRLHRAVLDAPKRVYEQRRGVRPGDEAATPTTSAAAPPRTPVSPADDAAAEHRPPRSRRSHGPDDDAAHAESSGAKAAAGSGTGRMTEAPTDAEREGEAATQRATKPVPEAAPRPEQEAAAERAPETATGREPEVTTTRAPETATGRGSEVASRRRPETATGRERGPATEGATRTATTDPSETTEATETATTGRDG